jgi:hypothetical protein
VLRLVTVAKRNGYFMWHLENLDFFEKFKVVYLGMKGDIGLKLMVEQA